MEPTLVLLLPTAFVPSNRLRSTFRCFIRIIHFQILRFISSIFGSCSKLGIKVHVCPCQYDTLR
ncbi:hypothetical protein NC653_001179 [Populus alba x Populus x berolinensis]|uniref:Uncharacterized protein n=1 Tax=Populus alba x Populus x berolinensis TaxID=444605 RepID=A0AAD6RKU5_9ROSI|nr:hypothetical protein NC653_001179 [Populus alba x Populus x berolinensis]